MRHIKLFENFGVNPIITATGDFSKLTKDGSSIDWTQPNTYMVTYHTTPSQKLRDLEGSLPGGADMTLDLEQGVEEIIGGDQNGMNLSQRDNGMVIFAADPSISPEDFKRELEDFINNFNENPEIEEDQCEEVLEDPDKRKYTPEFLNHCKAVVSGSGMFMNPRITLIFKVV